MRLKEDPSILERADEDLLTIDCSQYLCSRPVEHGIPNRRCIPVSVSSPGLRDSEVIEHKDCEYFVINETQFLILFSLRICFNHETVCYFTYNESAGSEASSLSSEESLLLDNGSLLNRDAHNVLWSINRDLCCSCWLSSINCFEREKFRYQNKEINLIAKSRLATLKTYWNEGGASRMRRVYLHGSLRVTVDSSQTIFDLKKSIAPRVNRLASSLVLFKYNHSIEVSRARHLKLQTALLSF